jgi:hypothetical protein
VTSRDTISAHPLSTIGIEDALAKQLGELVTEESTLSKHMLSTT